LCNQYNSCCKPLLGLGCIHCGCLDGLQVTSLLVCMTGLSASLLLTAINAVLCCLKRGISPNLTSMFAGADNPEKKRGWVVHSQPSIDTNRADGNTVQMLRQTWDKPASNIRITQGQQPAESTQYGLQAQLQASMMERRNKLSHQLQ